MSEGVEEPSEANLMDEHVAANTTTHARIGHSSSPCGKRMNSPIFQKHDLSRIPSFKNPQQELHMPSLDSNQAGGEEADPVTIYSIRKLFNSQSEEKRNTSETGEKIINIYGALEPFESKNLRRPSQKEDKSFEYFATQSNAPSSKTTNQHTKEEQQGKSDSSHAGLPQERPKEALSNSLPFSARTNFQQVMDIYKPLEPFENHETPTSVSRQDRVKIPNQPFNYSSSCVPDKGGSSEEISQKTIKSPTLAGFDPSNEMYKPLEPFEDNKVRDEKPFNYYSLPHEKDTHQNAEEKFDATNRQQAIDLYGPLEPFEGSDAAPCDEEATTDSKSPAHVPLQPTRAVSLPNRIRQRSKSMPAEETEDGDDINQPGAFYVFSRAEGERPSWTQETYEAEEPPSIARRNMVQHVSATLPPTPQQRADSQLTLPSIAQEPEDEETPPESPRVSQFLSAEIESASSKTKLKRMKVWIPSTAIILLILGVAIGLSVGLRGNSDIGEQNIIVSITEEEICNYAEATDISLAWKKCLCGESSTTFPDGYESRYKDLQISLKDHLEPTMQNSSSCEPSNVALLWLTEDMMENNKVYDDHQVVSRFALASCFLTWYDYNKPWKNKKGWMTSENECKWFGVMCNEKNEVISLSLRNNQLAGSIPEQLVILSQLSRLDLNDNAITGSIPTELGSLNSLVRLDLQNNKIARRVPTEIGQLTLLKDIDLSSNFISGTLPTSIASCVALQELRLTNNMLITTIPTELGNLGNLEILDLSYQEELHGVIPTTIGSCASLNEIRLDIGRKMTGIIPTEIGQLSDLQVFSAGYNELSGSIPSTFANLSQLAILNLMANRLTGVISPSIGIYNALLRQIRLTGNLISGSIPTEIGLLSNLIALEILGNKIGGYIPTELGLCTSLKLIDVSYNFKLIGEVPSELGALSGLETFNLANTAMVGNMPLEICELPKLKSLEANCFTKITNCDCCTRCLVDYLG
mmetsp:Transcript_12193/g.18819  ORF Transcript_12193/g.18819 Transcript_12193/m.18819 type:complete len:978 (+) Transcript_12193:184-3117(+)